MTTQNAKVTEVAKIQQLIESWVRAVRAKDVDEIVSHCAPDIVSFDLAALPRS